jgi:hypothetical protein
MNKINQNQQKDQKRGVTRILILPVKSYVAKVIMTDISKLLQLFSTEERLLIIKQFEDPNFKFNDTDNKFREYFDTLFLIQNEIQLIIKFRLFPFFANKYLKKNDFSSDFSYYKVKKNIPIHLSEFVVKGYKLIKVKCTLAKSEFKSFNAPDNIKQITAINDLNFELELAIKDYFGLLIRLRNSTTINKRLSEIYDLFNLSDSDLKKETIIKHYHRNKNKLSKRNYQYTGYFKRIYTDKFSNQVVLHLYEEFLAGKTTIKEISSVLSISETAVKDIFSHPDIQKNIDK